MAGDSKVDKPVWKMMKEWDARLVFFSELQAEVGEIGGAQGREHFRLEISFLSKTRWPVITLLFNLRRRVVPSSLPTIPNGKTWRSNCLEWPYLTLVFLKHTIYNRHNKKYLRITVIRSVIGLSWNVPAQD